MQLLNKLALTVSAFALTAGLNAANATTMPEAVMMAIHNHPDVVMARQNHQALGHSVREAKAGWMPTLNYEVGYGFEHSENESTRAPELLLGQDGEKNLARLEGRVFATQNIYDGSATRANVRQQKMRQKSAAFNTVETQEIVALTAMEAYLNVLRARELVALGAENLQMHQKYLGMIQGRTSGGQGTRADVRQAEGRVALSKANMEAFRGELRTAESDYLEVVGTMPSNLSMMNAPFSAIPGSLEEALGVAMDTSPAIKSAQADIQAAQASVKLAKSRFCPRLDLEADASRGHNLDGSRVWVRDAKAMLMLRQNLYNGGADTAAVKERISRVGEAKGSLERSRRLVEENVMNAWSDLVTAQNRLTPLNNHVVASNDTRQAYEGQFQLGGRSLLDLLDSEVEVFNSKSALINGKYAVDLAAYAVLAHMGQLVNMVNATQVASR